MIVTCPHCSKRYRVSEALLSEKGQNVRCMACRYVWRETLEPPLSFAPSPLAEESEITKPRHGSRKCAAVGLGAVIVLLIGLGAALIYGQRLLIAKWPQIERLYVLTGLYRPPPGAGLMITDARSSQVGGGATENMIWVVGDIVNTSSHMVSIPPLKIKFMGAKSHPNCASKQSQEECVLDHREHRLLETSLLPGEKVHFETEPSPKVEGIQHIVVEF